MCGIVCAFDLKEKAPPIMAKVRIAPSKYLIIIFLIFLSPFGSFFSTALVIAAKWITKSPLFIIWDKSNDKIL